MFRLLEINFVDYDQLYPIHSWEYKNFHEIHKRKVQITYTLSNKFEIILFGFDGKKKWNTTSVSKLNDIFKVIDQMPMGNVKVDKNDISKLENQCGFYKYSPIHCFQDSTHQTCCLLGKNAREYADKSGNPIGKESENTFYKNYNFKPNDNTLTPWCTCIGSEVCSYYSKKFGKKDGTHIKFINDKNNNLVFDRNEKKYLRFKHDTPGIF